METGNSSYKILIDKLDEFIRKYYKNQLIRGLIYGFTVFLGFYLLVTTLEYFGHFNTSVRTTLFYLFVLTNLAILVKLIFIPLFHLYKLGKIISHEQAAKIIGGHFSGVKDKLLNTLQLHKLSVQEVQNSDLLHASIDQRIAELKPVPFTSAIDLGRNKKYLRFAAIPVLLLLIIVFAAPSLIKEGTSRLVQHSTYYAKPAPFTFEVLNKDLKVVQLGDFELNVKVKGTEVPENAYIKINGNQFKLEKENTVSFNYTFKNVQTDTKFVLTANGFSSDEYELNAVPNPLVMNFDIHLQYPGYLNKTAEDVKNTGDLIVPQGTKIKWNFNTRNTEVLRMGFTDTSITLTENDNGKFAYSRSVMQNNVYSVVTSNQFMKSKDSMMYNIAVIPDLYPSILVEQTADSLSLLQYYFKGQVRDDYGFSKLVFTYKFLKSSDSLDRIQKVFSENIAITKNTSQDQFFYYWDLAKLLLSSGDELEYYFEVFDNDGVNGAKSARSQTHIYKTPTMQELAENSDKARKEMKNDLKDNISKAKKLQKEIDDAAKKMLEKKNLDFDDKKKIEDLLKEQKELEKRVNEMQKQMEQNLSRENEFKKNDSQIAEKQQQLQELFNRVMSDDMKKMMEELEKLMSQIDKKKVDEALDKMKLNNKDLEKELDRALELFKSLEVEQKMKDAVKNLEDLAKDQEKLADKTEQKGDVKNSEENKDLNKEQKDLNEKFDQLQKDLKDAEEKNEKLEFPQAFPDTKEEQKDIEKEMDNSDQETQQGQNKSASKSQKSASKKMKDMAEKMKMMMEQNETQADEQAEEDLRYLLENLIEFSFNQEKLMQDLKDVDVNNPRYVKLSQQQRKLKDDAKILEDSLFALSKRVPQISSAVNQEISKVNDNIGKSISNLQDRIVPQARVNQQFVMTSANNLALMLDEAKDQMQQQQKKKGGKACKKPGKGSPSPTAAELRKQQEKFMEKLKKMKEGDQKDGQGQKKPGQQQPGQSQSMSEQLARLAAEQEAIRNAVNEMNREENKDGQGKMGDLGKLAQQMEETEKDIVNRRITEETLKRQQEILTRLLESEKAEREREQDEKRKSNENKAEFYRNPAQFEEYKKLKMHETELLKTVPPALNPFYKNLVNSYFQNLQF